MKEIPQVLLDRINAKSLESFILFRIGPNAALQEYMYTTLPYDYTNPVDSKSYSKENRVVEIEPINASASLDKSTIRVTLSDSDVSLRASLDSWKMHGAPLVLYGGAINNTGSSIGGIAPGNPFDEKVVVYEGTVDTFSYIVTPDDNILLSVEGASPMAALDLNRTILTSKTYLNQEYPDDTSYDQVYEGSKELLLDWGKK